MGAQLSVATCLYRAKFTIQQWKPFRIMTIQPQWIYANAPVRGSIIMVAIVRANVLAEIVRVGDSNWPVHPTKGYFHANRNPQFILFIG